MPDARLARARKSLPEGYQYPRSPYERPNGSREPQPLPPSQSVRHKPLNVSAVLIRSYHIATDSLPQYRPWLTNSDFAPREKE